MMRGQKFEHGFVSGLVGKIGGGVAESYFPGDGMGDMLGKASVIGLFSGIASEAVGGDFYEGAVEAAFVYLYNDVWDQYASKICLVPKLQLGDADWRNKTLKNSYSNSVYRSWSFGTRKEWLFGFLY